MKPPWRWAACVVALGLVVTGCGRSAPKQSAQGQTGGERPAAAASRPIREQLLAGAVTILSGLDRYDEARVRWQQTGLWADLRWRSKA